MVVLFCTVYYALLLKIRKGLYWRLGGGIPNEGSVFYCCVSVDSKSVFRGHQQGNPLVYDVNFTEQEMKITAHLEDYEQILFENGVHEIVVPYAEIEQATLSICSRVWGMSLIMVGHKIYNFDLQIRTRDWKKIHLEFMAFYEWKEVLERMKRNNVNIIDQCGIYKEFSSKEDFNKNFHASMEDRFEQLAR